MTDQKKRVERIQTGVRIEKRLLKVLKAMAAEYEMGLGDLLEGIVLHSLEGRSPFDEDSQIFIRSLRAAYDLDLVATDSHKLLE
ncbi:MAG: hypothetical protein AAGD43_04140 [Pseudomonadota bacterium]